MSACDCSIPDGRKAPRRGVLSRAVEQREMKRRENEATRAEVERFYLEQKRSDNLVGNPLKEDTRRKEREAKERNQEAQLLESLYQNERQQELSLIRAEEEERLATALVKRMHETERHGKEVQHLREQSAELRELAEKIRTARVNKERALQIQEKSQIKLQQAEYNTAIDTFVAQTNEAGAAREAEFQARRREQAVKARQVLEEQMAERKDLLREAEIEAARERAMVDEIVRCIQAEDQASVTLRRQKQDETKAYIARFLAETEAARMARRAVDAAEDKKVAEYWEMVRQREAHAAAIAADKKEAADRLYDKIKREMEVAAAAKEEEEQLINLLRQEEAEEKKRLEDEARQAKSEQMRREIKAANEYQMRLKEERDREMKAEEEEFRRIMMAKFAEDDRLEQLNAQKRRMKQAEHQRAVADMIAERRRMYEDQKAREEAEVAAQAAEEARRNGILEGERRRLLQEAAELKDYLPKGIIRDQSDLDYMNQHLATLNLSYGQRG